MIAFNCPECSKQIRVKPELAGRTGKCPGCGQKIVVPSVKPALSLVGTESVAKPLSLAKPIVTASVAQAPERIRSTPSYSPNIQSQTVPTTAVQVNVHNSNVSNSLGISSLVLGIVAFFVCWMPFIGLCLSGLGLLLGIVGIAMAAFRKGTGIGYSIAGSAINSIALLIAMLFTALFAGAVATVDQTVKRIEAERNKPQLQATPVAPDKTIEPIPTTTVDEEIKPSIVWHPASDPLQLGEVQLRIMEVTLGKVPLKQAILDQDTVSKEEHMTIRVQITNTSTTKKLDYTGWMTDFSSLSGITAKLADENDNNYKPVRFSGMLTVKGANASESIYPGKTLDDAIVFEPPIENAQRLLLTLSAKGCKQEGEFRFEIPRSMINR